MSTAVDSGWLHNGIDGTLATVDYNTRHRGCSLLRVHLGCCKHRSAAKSLFPQIHPRVQSLTSHAPEFPSDHYTLLLRVPAQIHQHAILTPFSDPSSTLSHAPHTGHSATRTWLTSQTKTTMFPMIARSNLPRLDIVRRSRCRSVRTTRPGRPERLSESSCRTGAYWANSPSYKAT